MIFEGRPIDEITDAEFDELVQLHVCEDQHLEFKETYKIKDKRDVSEVLKDIVSLANAGGGYFIIGIQDDGHGKAAGYRPHTKEDLNGMKQSIQQICMDHIVERVPRIESKIREPNSNPILVIHIPESGQTPHMVKFDRRTDFYSRYDDGKREMSFSEIRDAFQHDRAQIRLDSMSHKVDEILRRLPVQVPITTIMTGEQVVTRRTKPFFPSSFSIGNDLVEAMYKRLIEEINDNPYFWITATPVTLISNFIDVGSPKIRDIVNNPPGSRPHGWNMELAAAINNIPDGIERGPKDFEYFALYNNAHMEFWTPLRQHFCWRQEKEDFEKRPELYPYPVVEYPVTFLRLYKAIMEASNLKGNFIINLRYLNLKGYRLRPFAPRQAGYIFADDVKPFDHDDLILPPTEIDHSFDPDVVTYQLLVQVYSAFGLSSDTVPFYQEGHFSFPG